MDKTLSNITEIYKEILDKRVVFEQTQKLHLFNGAFCKSGSGPEQHAKSNPTDWTGKRAWDMIGAEGTSVSAIDGGTIISVRDNPYVKGKTEFGRNVTVKTDKDTHYYSNLSITGPKIQEGGKIVQGDFIGKIGKPQEDPNWGPHLHIALERGDLRNFLEDNCSLKKMTTDSNSSSSGSTSGTTDLQTGDLYTKTGIGDVVAKGLNLESKKKKRLNESTLSAPIPMPNKITHGFDEKRGNRIHGGIDIPATVGTPIKSIADGQVIAAGSLDSRCGDGISISHADGFVSSYCHLSGIKVNKGATVKQGQVIGLTGGARGAKGSGNSGGPHLHLTLKKDGQRVDPLKYIDKSQISDIKFDELPSNVDGLDLDDKINYDSARNSLYNQDVEKDSESLYKKTGIADLLLKPLGLAENEIDEEKIYGEFGKDQKTKYGSITLPKEKNSKIKSPVAGKIVRGSYNPSCSNQISILHVVDKNDFILEYCGVKKPSVKIGDRVNNGTTLGQTDTDVIISLFDNTGSRVYIDNYIKKEIDKTKVLKKSGIDKEPRLYDSPWGRVLGSIILSPFKAFQDKYDESGELKQKRWSSPTEKIQPDDWISQSSPTYSKKLKEQIERIKKIL